MRKLWTELLSAKSEISSRRFVVLITSMYFILVSFTLPIIVYLFIIKERDQKVIEYSFNLLDKIIDYNFLIIAIGFGFITTSAFAQALITRFQAKVIGAIQGTPENMVVNQQVGEQNVSAEQVVNEQAQPPVEQAPPEGEQNPK